MSVVASSPQRGGGGGGGGGHSHRSYSHSCNCSRSMVNDQSRPNGCSQRSKRLKSTVSNRARGYTVALLASNFLELETRAALFLMYRVSVATRFRWFLCLVTVLGLTSCTVGSAFTGVCPKQYVLLRSRQPLAPNL